MSKSNRKKEQLKQRLLKAAKVRSKRLGLPSQGELLIARQYEEAVEAWERGDRREALVKLQALDLKYPHREDILRALTAWSQQLGQRTEQLYYCRKLVEAAPDDPEVWYYLGEAHLRCTQPVLARCAFQTAVSRWPDHEFAEGGRQMLAKIGHMLPSAVTYVPGLNEAERWELAEAHERIMIDLHEGRLEQVPGAATRLLAKWPTFIPARNNAAEAQFHLGRLPEALAIAQETVRLFPDNAYALASLIRFLTLGGNEEQGLQLVDRLQSMPLRNLDHLVCSLQTYALLGLDETLLEAWRKAEPEMVFDDAHKEAMCLHLAAVAASRLGQFGPARRDWTKALEICPTLAEAAENLEDCDRPVGHRHGAWPFDVSFWVSRQFIDQTVKIMDRSDGRAEYRRKLQQLLLERPALVPLFTLMLRRGDPIACQFVIGVAKDAGDSPLIEPLRRFALGQFGSDELRSGVLFWLFKEGFLEGCVQRVWNRGEWHEIRLSEVDICREPTGNHSPQVADLTRRAFDVIIKDPRQAERLIREALELEPDAPDLLNNLAAALQGQRRHDEAHAITRDIQRRFPDYFFGQLALAHEQVSDGDLDAAKKTLEKLMARSQMHFSEYAALGEGYIRVAVESEDVEEARTWLKRIEDVYPDYHALGDLRQAVAWLAARNEAGGIGKKRRFLGGMLK